MIPRRIGFLSPLPYFAAFVAAPFAVLAGKLTGQAELFHRFGPHGLTPWLMLSAFALAACLLHAAHERSHRGLPRWPVLAIGLGLGASAWLLTRLIVPLLGDAQNLAPLLDELRLPALLSFSALWAWSFGAPERCSLSRAGAALGALVVLDFLLTAIMAHSLVLGGGYLFGETAGTSDILAFLLCLALAATLDDTREPGAPRLARWLILAGLLATFSRPGLAAGGLMCLVLEQGPFRHRLAMALSCAMAAWLSLALPLPRLTGGDDLGLGWHLAATLEALAQDPRGYLMGLPLDTPLALAMPDFQGLIWDDESQGLPVSAFNIPSSGLRLLAAWGIGGPLAVLGAAGFCAARGRSRFGLGLLTALILCAALTPVLHVPACAAALALALASAARKGTTATERSEQSAT
ncbi:MAG: hypothetical protein Q8O35_04720 [Humidesulfovibrio sp.]|uniref:hypothetical protein n=1 Tax=Humidesulfovibrio sp. TaxID=2910988 RepID=UPI0027359957|nr:hypothetical protein [Humidesulfovibrio sp.]MDP2847479.1 hypothetical protein [Humidesulfovibrio sp.]